jgi:beta-glucosidase
MRACVGARRRVTPAAHAAQTRLQMSPPAIHVRCHHGPERWVGLSDSRFSCSNLSATRAADGGLDVTFKVANPTHRAGDEVPQVYLGAPDSQPVGVQFAVRALAGYTRVTVPASGSRLVTVHVRPRQLQYWSTAAQKWVIATGNRTVYVGASSRDLRAQAAVHIAS